MQCLVFSEPENVPNIDISSSPVSFNVSWQEPAIRSPCTISGYSVSYRLTELDQCKLETGPLNSIDTLLTETTITGLESHSTYEISVAAYSGLVYGDSDAKSVKTDENGEFLGVRISLSKTN